jgi:hypothetical protein
VIVNFLVMWLKAIPNLGCGRPIRSSKLVTAELFY